MPGVLYVVATPIGNLRDLSPRAAEVLRQVDRIAAEDTRHSRRLLDSIGSTVPTLSCHDHNEKGRAQELVTRLQAGESVALISDAGTPAIADPGYRVVLAAREAGLPVVSIPGPSAAMAALSASGLPSDRFLFLGFLSPKPGRARRQIEEVASLRATLILYESPHRLGRTLTMLEAVLGDRSACLARELTKRYEEMDWGLLPSLRERWGAVSVRGELVILVAPPPRHPGAEEDASDGVEEVDGDGDPPWGPMEGEEGSPHPEE